MAYFLCAALLLAQGFLASNIDLSNVTLFRLPIDVFAIRNRLAYRDPSSASSFVAPLASFDWKYFKDLTKLLLTDEEFPDRFGTVEGDDSL